MGTTNSKNDFEEDEAESKKKTALENSLYHYSDDCNDHIFMTSTHNHNTALDADGYGDGKDTVGGRGRRKSFFRNKNDQTSYHQNGLKRGSSILGGAGVDNESSSHHGFLYTHNEQNEDGNDHDRHDDQNNESHHDNKKHHDPIQKRQNQHQHQHQHLKPHQSSSSREKRNTHISNLVLQGPTYYQQSLNFIAQSAAHLLTTTATSTAATANALTNNSIHNYEYEDGYLVRQRSRANVRSLSNSSLFLSESNHSNHSNNNDNKRSSSNLLLPPLPPNHHHHQRRLSQAQKIITVQQNLIMGPSPPPIYEMALIGQWKELLSRINYYPNEVLYRDKCFNTALHLVCRRDPPYDVVKALLDVLMSLSAGDGDGDFGGDIDPNFSSSGSSRGLGGEINSNSNTINNNQPKRTRNGQPLLPRRRKCYLGGVTMDGLTPLHFAAYCGASPDVIDLLLRYENDALLKYHTYDHENNRRCSGGGMEVPLNNTKTMDKGEEEEDDDDDDLLSSSSISKSALNQNQSSTDEQTTINTNNGTAGIVDDYENQFSKVSNSLYDKDYRCNKNSLLDDGDESQEQYQQQPMPQSTSVTSLSSLHENNNANKSKNQHSHSSKVRFKLPKDRRGRTALHSICAGFRTSNRPLNIYLLLSYDPTCVLVEDKKCKTALSLMYDDYAEEIEELLTMPFTTTSSKYTTTSTGSSTPKLPSCTNEKMETILFFEKGSMNECWKILVLLLKAVYLGSVIDDESDDFFSNSGGTRTSPIHHHSHKDNPFENLDNGCDIDDENRSTCSSDYSGVATKHEEGGSGDDDLEGKETDDDDDNFPQSEESSDGKQENRPESPSEKLNKTIEARSFHETDEDIADGDSDGFNPASPNSVQSRFRSDWSDLESNSEASTTDDMTSSPETNDGDNGNSHSFSKSHKAGNAVARKKTLVFPKNISSPAAGLLNHLSLPPLLNESTPITPSLLSFSLIHAAASIPYSCPYGFFQLLLKVSPNKVREFDDGYNSRSRSKRKRQNKKSKAVKDLSALPLHLATKSLPPLSYDEKIKTSPLPSNNQQSLSTSFHGYESIVYQDPSSEFIISYDSQSKSKQNKQFHTASFVQPTISSSMIINSTVTIPTPIISHLIDAYPEAAGIPEPSSGKYPIELAIESGKSFFSVIEPLLNAFPHMLYPSNEIEQNSNNSINFEAVGIDRIYSRVGIHRIFASLSMALMNSSMLIRHEAAITVGCIVKKLSGFIEGMNSEEYVTLHKFFKQNGGDLPNPSTIDPDAFNVEEFILQLIRSSDGTMNIGNVNDDPYSNTHFMTDDEWGSVQSTTLKALSNAFRNACPEMFSENSETPKKALNAAENMIRHGDVAVRESAASVLGAVLAWLDIIDSSSLLQRFLVINVASKEDSSRSIKSRKKKDDTDDGSKLSSSMHSMFSSASAASGNTQKVSNVKPKLKHTLSRNQYKMLHSELPHIKHGKALSLLRLLISKKGKKLVKKGIINFKDVTNIVKEMMLDTDIEVRKAACLTIGAILGRSTAEVETLKIVRHAILKCMRSSEEEGVQVALARGLMLATVMKPNIFVCKAGLGLIECAMILGVTSTPKIQKIFCGFLWLALGVGDKDSPNSGLSTYMELAEGENGLIMMNLVTKELSRINSIQDVLWL